MSATNHTPNLNLSQFIPLDKPAWLGDYNSDMSKIDTAVHKVQTQADSMETAVEQATTAAQAATQAAQAATEAAQDAADKAQDAETTANNIAGSLAGKVNKTGDTMTGPLVLPGDPTEDNQAATKGYVDNHGGGLPTTGGTMTGPVHFTNNGVKRGIIQTSADDFSLGVDSKGGATLSFPASGAGIQFTGNLISKNGTGQIKNLADPTEDQDAATKAYVDANSGSLDIRPVVKPDVVLGNCEGFAIVTDTKIYFVAHFIATGTISLNTPILRITGFAGLSNVTTTNLFTVGMQSAGTPIKGLVLTPSVTLGSAVSMSIAQTLNSGDWITASGAINISFS